jgi:hypothetical protein
MCEFLVKAIDATHADPVKDLRGCYKRGDIVDVREDGFGWGLEEGPPKFFIVKVPGLKPPLDKMKSWISTVDIVTSAKAGTTDTHTFSIVGTSVRASDGLGEVKLADVQKVLDTKAGVSATTATKNAVSFDLAVASVSNAAAIVDEVKQQIKAEVEKPIVRRRHGIDELLLKLVDETSGVVEVKDESEYTKALIDKVSL